MLPEKPRSFAGQRWLNIALRSLHLVGVAGCAGGFLFAVDESSWRPFWQLTVLSGFALMALYVWTSAVWLGQLKGLVIFVKLALLWLALSTIAWRAELFSLVILLSAVIAHAPGVVRAYVPFQKGGQGGQC